MQIVQQVLFALVSIVAIWMFVRKAFEIRANILLGREEDYSDSKGERWKQVLLIALGQKKMFRKPLVAFLHFLIYAGFIIINIEVLEIFLDGLFGTHRLFSGGMGAAYLGLINAFEFLAVGVLVSCIAFLARRNILKLKRFISHDLDGWPRSDANYILITEILLMCFFLTLNASDTLLQERAYGHYATGTSGNFFFSHLIHPLINGLSNEQLVALERACWWLHIVGIFAFLN